EVLRHRKLYYAMIENLDENVGRIMRYLEGEKLLDKTIILFMADHGEQGGAHRLTHKQFTYEESVGVPLIVSGPGIPQEGQLDTPCCSEDPSTTLLGLAGLRTRDQQPGCDLSALIRKETDGVD